MTIFFSHQKSVLVLTFQHFLIVIKRHIAAAKANCVLLSFKQQRKKKLIFFDVYLRVPTRRQRCSSSSSNITSRKTFSNYKCVADKRNILRVFIRFSKHLASQSCLCTTHFTFRMSDSLSQRVCFRIILLSLSNKICL